MPSEPQIKGLTQQARGRFFWLLVLVFLVTLPTLVFYTTGYRLSFENEETSIVPTGGIYVTTSNSEASVYLDEELVERPRLFRSAYYIQTIAAGQHRLVVQQPELHTWVKEIPVDPHIVTEVISFNMPELSQLRPVAPYRTATDTPVLIADPEETIIIDSATTTISFVRQEATSTVPLVASQEYKYVSSLFVGRSSTTQPLLSVFASDDETDFRFAKERSAAVPTTTVRTRDDYELYERNGELYVRWLGSDTSIPFYFCVSKTSPGHVARRYGMHVRDAMFDQIGRATSTLITVNKEKLCRPEIKLDRQWHDVYWFNFMPDNPDLVLLHRSDGLYVTEIDDRAWQNSQPLYRGDNIRVVTENNTIYVYDNGQYFELLTEIEESG